ncbi:MAG: DUF485 domain-containing protein [Planctomycetaceae bacterium]|nr:DUF485 domain-containing protein [Planctomycetaceae bacterium]
MAARNARIGLILFGIYLVIYGSFVLLNALAPQLMESTPFAGVNLAILFGFGLIIAAFVLSLLYGWLCSASESVAAEQATAQKETP